MIYGKQPNLHTDGTPPVALRSICYLGGGSQAQPQAPNPQQTAQAQTQSNVETAVSNAYLGNTNQVTPYGTLTYNQTGTRNVGGNAIPQFTATQTLSPEQQKIYDSQTALTNQALGGIAPNILNQIQNTTQNPLNFSGAPAMPGDQTQAKNAAYAALTARSNQDLDRQTSQQQTQLANQGIAAGSEAYNNALQPLERARVDASNQATLNASNLSGQDINQAQTLRNQYINEATQQYNQPLNTYAALTGVSGGTTQPTYAAPSAGQVAPTDVAGIYNNAYQNQLQQYQQQQGQNNSLMGGLFGLGGSALGAGIFKYSDRRLKRNIVRIGERAGLPLYAYEIDGRPDIGVMADEVAKVRPDAVTLLPSGFYAVNYEMIYG